MKHHVIILEESFDVDFTAHVTYPGHPADDSDPGGAIEFSLEINALTDASGNSLEVPGWLGDLIRAELEQDQGVYNAIAEENR